MAAGATNRAILGGGGMLLLILGALIAWEIQWGQGLEQRARALSPPGPRPVPLGLIKEFSLGGIALFAESAQRPIMIPTRRPAPPSAASEARTRMNRGQFVLMGTMLAGGKNFALLRESNGTKQLRVAQGDAIKGMTVEKVEAHEVTLRLEDETEVLALKTLIAPRPPAAKTGPGAKAPGPGEAANPPDLAAARVDPAGVVTRPVPGAAAEAQPGQAPQRPPREPRQNNRRSGAVAPEERWSATFDRMRQRNP